MPIAVIADWLITAGSVTLALGAIWHFWGKPVQQWIQARVDTAEARLVGIERQLIISNGGIKTTEGRVNEIVESLEERRTSIDPLIASIGERAMETDAVLRAHILEAAPMLRAFNREHPETVEPPARSTPAMPPLGSPSLPSAGKE